MTSQTTAPAIIHKLVETFEQNLDSYRFSKNETELRRQFLDPFFTALGWDVANEKGYDELGKEVTHEFSVDVAGQQKKADYAFRVGRGEKFDFLVEAKKPSVKVETSQEAAFQIRRYGWSAKLPINILTDFEHFAVYDCRTKPNINDKASMGRIMLIHYKDFVLRWNEIVEIFSPEAVRKGSFAKYAEGMKGKKGTADVDDAFLQEIERWRELLAKNIALRNDDIDIAGLNYSVQMTIDRIVFLRISEERGIEPENQLLGIANNENSYEELCELFKRADTKYNSGLFHFKNEKEVVSRPDDLTLSLEIDNKVLKDIISNLYYPKSPYAFLYIPSDILGQVYERFLGKVIRLTDGHQAKVEEKPEVRKAGGVYYTPTYIVEYIVENTVGKLVENKTPKDVASLKVVDPACGSGTFLLGAYQFLLDWHLNWYSENEPEKAEKSKAIVKVGDGYRLTTAKKKEILLNNIHGVDIDAQAVEVTKLSLLLKVLENASGQLGLGMERVLPDLGNNIKFGNSLIGFNYFEGQLIPNEEEQASVNPFDWQNEFKNVFAKGGFDVTIGNPPYVFGGNYGIEQNYKGYFKKHFFSGSGKINLFTLFIEKSTNILRDGGLLSFIIPNTLLRVTSYGEIREFMLKQTAIKKITDMGVGVFSGATTSSVIIVLEKSKKTIENIIEIRMGIDDNPQMTSQSNFLSDGYVLNIKATSQDTQLLNKLNIASVNLGELCEELIFGVVITKNRDDVVSDKPVKGYKPFLEGKDISRYLIRPTEKYLLYKPELLHRPRTPRIFEAREKILIQRITGGSRPLNAAYDNQQHYNKESINNIILKDDIQYSVKYILGLINSKLFSWFYRTKFTNASTLTVNLSKEYLSQLPIRLITFSDSAEKTQHNKMIGFVEQMLVSHKSLSTAQTPQEKERLERQIEFTDKAIDSLVYELYGLTNEEIKIVEGE